MPASHTRSTDLFLIAAICPLVAASDTVVNAVVLGVGTVLVAAVSVAIVGAIGRWLAEEIRLPASLLIVASVVAIVELAMRAWFHVARESLAIFLPLIVTNLALLHYLSDSARGVRANFVRVVKLAGKIASVLLILGFAREIVGRGSLLHDAQALIGSLGREITLFHVDMGFLLAMLPPGAFLAFGLLLAMRNWLSTSRTVRE